MYDLVSKVRGLSRAARRCVDTLEIPNAARWFGRRDSKISRFLIRSRTWPLPSVGLFLRMGGTIDDTIEDENSLGSFEYDYDISDYNGSSYQNFHDYSDNGFGYSSDYGSLRYW